MPEHEQHLVQNQWAGLPVLDGTRWWKPGEYSGFYFQPNGSCAFFMLPVTKNGGFVIHEDEEFQFALQADSRTNAVIRIRSKSSDRKERLLFWSREDSEGEAIRIKKLNIPSGTIIFRN